MDIEIVSNESKAVGDLAGLADAPSPVKVNVEIVREITRTPSPTLSEAEALQRRGIIHYKSLLRWRFWLRRKWISESRISSMPSLLTRCHDVCRILHCPRRHHHHRRRCPLCRPQSQRCSPDLGTIADTYRNVLPISFNHSVTDRCQWVLENFPTVSVSLCNLVSQPTGTRFAS